MNYAVDCSFSSALFLPDEKSGDVSAFFMRLKPADRVFIPLLWWYETANVLSVAIKRKRLTHNQVFSISDLLEKLPFETDMRCGAEHARHIVELSQLYNLSSYDAAYIELAVRTKSKLMSLDAGMISAAKEIGL